MSELGPWNEAGLSLNFGHLRHRALDCRLGSQRCVPKLAVAPGALETLRKADCFFHGHVQRLQSTSSLSASLGPALSGCPLPAPSAPSAQISIPSPFHSHGMVTSSGSSSAAVWDPQRQLESSPGPVLWASDRTGEGGVLPNSLLYTLLMLFAAVVTELWMSSLQMLTRHRACLTLRSPL